MSWIWYVVSVVVTVVTGCIASYWVLPKFLRVSGEPNCHVIFHLDNGDYVGVAGHVDQVALKHMVDCVGRITEREAQAANEMLDTFSAKWLGVRRCEEAQTTGCGRTPTYRTPAPVPPIKPARDEATKRGDGLRGAEHKRRYRRR